VLCPSVGSAADVGSAPLLKLAVELALANVPQRSEVAELHQLLEHVRHRLRHDVKAVFRHDVGDRLIGGVLVCGVEGYNGSAFISRSGFGLNPFRLEGYGVATARGGVTVPLVIPSVVRISIAVGRFNPIETVVQFGDMSNEGSLMNVTHRLDCDVEASQQGDGAAFLTFTDGFDQVARLSETNLLHTKAL